MGRELKRVALDFKWPLRVTYIGLLNPFWAHYRKECQYCAGSGSSPGFKRLTDLWYGYETFHPSDRGSIPFEPDHPVIQASALRNYPESEFQQGREAIRLAALFNGRWSHHLNEDDVSALIEGNRLYDFTSTFVAGEGWKKKDPAVVPTPAQVNEWSIVSFGHDSINQWIVCKAEAKRLGITEECSHCNGHGDTWPDPAIKQMSDDWVRQGPPAGDGFQMWETTSEGSPISPVCATAEELGHWLADNNASAFGAEGASYESWMRMIDAEWAPSMIMQGGRMMSGVEAAGTLRGEATT